MLLNVHSSAEPCKFLPAHAVWWKNLHLGSTASANCSIVEGTALGLGRKLTAFLQAHSPSSPLLLLCQSLYRSPFSKKGGKCRSAWRWCCTQRSSASHRHPWVSQGPGESPCPGREQAAALCSWQGNNPLHAAPPAHLTSQHL